MIRPLQCLADLAKTRAHSESEPFAASLSEGSGADDSRVQLLLGLGLLGRLFRTSEDVQQLATVGTDVYLLVAILATDDSASPPAPAALAALAMTQVERYTASPHGERWLQQSPLWHLARAFEHWTACGGKPEAATSVVLADLANYLVFFLACCGALDPLEDATAAHDSP